MNVTTPGTGAGLGPLSPPEKKNAFEVLDPGHRYSVQPTEWGDAIEIKFVKKVPAAQGVKVTRQEELATEHDGLTTEGVIAVLISRMHYLESMVPCRENTEAIGGLTVALNALERRTQNRKMRGVEGTSQL